MNIEDNLDSKYATLIEKLIAATKRGKMKWIKENPTTLYVKHHTKSGKAAILSIQALISGSQKRNSRYLLTLKNANDKGRVVTIDSSKHDYFKEILGNLFTYANYQFESDSVDFFEDFINGLDKDQGMS